MKYKVGDRICLIKNDHRYNIKKDFKFLECTIVDVYKPSNAYNYTVKFDEYLYYTNGFSANYIRDVYEKDLVCLTKYKLKALLKD